MYTRLYDKCKSIGKCSYWSSENDVVLLFSGQWRSTGMNEFEFQLSWSFLEESWLKVNVFLLSF